MHAGRKRVTRVCPANYAAFSIRRGGKEERKGEKSVLPAKRCIIENHLECDYLQPPSNAVHLPPLTWWITSFYDGNGSLPRTAPIKGGRGAGWPVYFHSSSATGFPLLSAHRMDPPIFRPFRHEAARCFGIAAAFLLRCLVRADLSVVYDRETKPGRRWRRRLPRENRSCRWESWVKSGFWKMRDLGKGNILALFNLGEDYVRDFTNRFSSKLFKLLSITGK